MTPMIKMTPMITKTTMD